MVLGLCKFFFRGHLYIFTVYRRERDRDFIELRCFIGRQKQWTEHPSKNTKSKRKSTKILLLFVYKYTQKKSDLSAGTLSQFETSIRSQDTNYIES